MEEKIEIKALIQLIRDKQSNIYETYLKGPQSGLVGKLYYEFDHNITMTSIHDMELIMNKMIECEKDNPHIIAVLRKHTHFDNFQVWKCLRESNKTKLKAYYYDLDHAINKLESALDHLTKAYNSAIMVTEALDRNEIGFTSRAYDAIEKDIEEGIYEIDKGTVS